MTETEHVLSAMKQWIDNASYKALLSRWRFARSGNPYFEGEVGDYYSKVMRRKREEVGDAEHTRISKQIGW